MNNRAYVERDHTAAICLNLYGWHNQINALNLYREFCRISDELNLNLGRVSYALAGEHYKIMDINIANFQKKYDEGIDSLSRIHIYKNKYLNSTDYNYPSCGIGINSYVDDDYFENFFYFYYESKENVLHAEYFNNLIIQISKYFKPTYGIGYLVEQRFVPAFYVSGFVQGRLEKLEQQRIGDWGRYFPYSSVPKGGELRDVYELNYLSDIHLKKPVSKALGKPMLRDWIVAADAGVLRRINDTLTLWELNLSRRDEIRQVLLDSGSLVATV